MQVKIDCNKINEIREERKNNGGLELKRSTQENNRYRYRLYQR